MRRQLKKYILAVSFMLALPMLVLAAVSYIGFDFPGATITEAFGINSQGTKIVGSRCTDSGTNTCNAPGTQPSHGYVRRQAANGTLQGYDSINVPGASETEATGINKAGRVVGLWDPPGVPAGSDIGHGYWCDLPGCLTSNAASFHTVDFPGAKSTDFTGINDHGDMTGLFSNTATNPIDHGFLRTANGKKCSVDVPTTLIPGALDTNTLGIDNENDLVGSFSDEVAGDIKAFLVTDVETEEVKDGGKCEIPDRNWFFFTYPVASLPAGATSVVQTEAAGVNSDNDDGGKKPVIVGNYVADPDNVSHAFKLSGYTLDKVNHKLVGGTFETIDYFKTVPGDNTFCGGTVKCDNAASAVNSKGTILVNYEDGSDSTVKERAAIRKP